MDCEKRKVHGSRVMLQKLTHTSKLLYTAASLLPRLLRARGLPLSSSNYVPELQRLALAGPEGFEGLAAQRLLAMIKFTNSAVYTIQKEGVRHFITQTFPARFNSSRHVSLPSSSALPAAGARVAFVMTSRTRERLKALGYDEEAIKGLRPAEAMEAVENNVPPASLAEFLLKQKNIQQTPQPVLETPEKGGAYDMSAVSI